MPTDTAAPVRVFRSSRDADIRSSGAVKVTC